MNGFSAKVISCARCGSNFIRAHSAERYCGHECKALARQAKQRSYERAYMERVSETSEYRSKRAQRQAEYRRKNPEKVAEGQATYRAARREEASERTRQWREADPARSRATARASYSKHKSKRIAHQSAKHKQRMEEDANYAINCRMSSAVRSALRDQKSGRPWETLVGYSLDELMRHLEKQFVRGMSWENRKEWDIDHIRPLSSFTFSDASDDEFRICWSLPNLRPMWASENRSKQARIVSLL